MAQKGSFHIFLDHFVWLSERERPLSFKFDNIFVAKYTDVRYGLAQFM
jgi:hypothetical protein